MSTATPATLKPRHRRIILIVTGVAGLAIAAALGDGRLGGAVCDVYAEQPLRRDHPFLKLDNMVLTAHMGGLTTESMKRLSIGSAQEVVRLLRDEKPVNFVNREVWDKHLERIRGFPVYR